MVLTIDIKMINFKNIKKNYISESIQSISLLGQAESK